MGSIRANGKLEKGREKSKLLLFSLFTFIFSLFIFFPIFPQNNASTVPLAGEISRLEKIASSAVSADRHSAFLALARLHQLSGNPEAALKAYEAALAISPDDGRTLLEQGRFLISVGEDEKSRAAINALLSGGSEKALLIQGRFLGAQLDAFRSGNTQPLAAMAEEPDFAEYRSGIYYTLWKLTGLESYRTRLIAEFPQSPEAKIAAGTVNFAATPLWLLFPGRESIVLATPTTAPQAAATPQTTATPAAATSAEQRPSPEPAGRLLQTGLFGREVNAQALAERLARAGFEPQIIKRQADGSDRWAVCVSGGSDMNATIRRLKDAGFESFPIQ